MKLIPAVMQGDVLHPCGPIPETAVRIVCDGQNYIVYERGDELPPAPHEGATQ